MKNRGIRMSSLLTLSNLAIVLLILSGAVFLFARTYQQQLIGTARTNSLRTVTQVSSTVNDYLAEINAVMRTLEEEMTDAEKQRTDFFDVFLRTRPDVVAVSTYDPAGNLSHCYSNLGPPTGTRSDGINLSLDLQRLLSEPDGYVSAPHVVTFFQDVYPWVITVVSPLENESGEHWIALDISCSDISSYISDSGVGRRGYCYLMDTDGNIVYHPQQQLIYSDLKTEDSALIASLEDGSYVEGMVIYAVKTLNNGQWRLVGVSFLQEFLTESLRQLGTILLILAALVLLAALLISAVVSTVLSHPLRDLEHAMEQFEEDADRFNYEPPKIAVREIRHLSGSFRDLVLKVQQLMKTVREEEINLRKTELRALQAQINPHFLYNTFFMLNSFIKSFENEKALKLSLELGKYFQYITRSSSPNATLREENDHARIYADIQAERYEGRISIRYDDLPEDMETLTVPRLIMQPLIENTFKHALADVTENGLLRVSFASDEAGYHITIEDNSNVLSDSDIDGMNDRLQNVAEDSEVTGCINIDRRLKMLYPAPSGLYFTRSPLGGLKAEILICMNGAQDV